MEKYETWRGVSKVKQGRVAAIGNFDGVHLGHRSVLSLVFMRAKQSGAQSCVITFEPHPRQYFSPNGQAFRLMNSAAKANRLKNLGLDCLFELSFDAALTELSPRDFCAQILSESLGVRRVIVGQDFRFGKARAGTVEDLAEFGKELSFDVEIAPMHALEGREVSSTQIRKALACGNPGLAAQFLGHWHRIEGHVQHGDKRGHTLGFPTANLSMEGLHLPKFGVYAAVVDILEGPYQGRYHGVSSLGVRPMFGVNEPNLETYLFDFSGDIYGASLSVGLVSYLRGEEKFQTQKALIKQMGKDCDNARSALEAIR